MFHVSSFGFRASDFGFRFSGFGFRFSGFRFRVSVFGFGVLGLGFGVWGLGLRVSDFGFPVKGEEEGVVPPHRFCSLRNKGRVPQGWGLGIQDWDLEFRVWGLGRKEEIANGFRVLGFESRVSSFEFRFRFSGFRVFGFSG